MDDIVKEFFNGFFEKQVNKNILFYKFPEETVVTYVKSVNNEPVSNYLTYIKNSIKQEKIEPDNICQFSNFADATSNLCVKLKSIDNPGLSHLEIGKLLQDDGKERLDIAYTKYGENHAKLASMLGLVFRLCSSYYLSGIGYIYTELSPADQEKLLIRLIIRTKLVTQLYKASQNGIVNLRDFLSVLSDSTYVRRRSNIKKVLNCLSNTSEYDFIDFIQHIELA